MQLVGEIMVAPTHCTCWTFRGGCTGSCAGIPELVGGVPKKERAAYLNLFGGDAEPARAARNDLIGAVPAQARGDGNRRDVAIRRSSLCTVPTPGTPLATLPPPRARWR